MNFDEQKFNELQSKIIELSQQNYDLREELKVLQKTNTNLPQYKEELEKCEKEREEINLFYTQTIQTLEKNLQNVRDKAEKKQKCEIFKLKEKINSVNEQIKEVKKNTKKSDEEIEEMKSLINEFEQSHQKKQIKLDEYNKKLEKLKYVVRFLKGTKRLPMYFEDLESRICMININKKKYDDDLADVYQQVTELHKQNVEYEKKIKTNNDLLNKSKADLESHLDEIKQASVQISNLNKTLSNSNQIYLELQSESERITEEYQNRFDEIEKEKTIKLNKCNEKVKELSILEDQLSEMKKRSDTKINDLNAVIKEQRKRLSNLNENGFDEEIPRVDIELQEQIDKVKLQKEELKDHIKMLEEALYLAKNELTEKDIENLKLIFNIEQITKINNSPEFQQKKLLLEELIYQNNQLNIMVNEMTKKIELLSKDNEKYWELMKQK